MGWREIRAKSRDVVHSTFARPAVYIAPNGAETPVNARLHGRIELIGDLERDGYAKRLEGVNYAVFDTLEVVPQKGGVVDFGADGKYEIVGFMPSDGSRYTKAEVSPL